MHQTDTIHRICTTRILTIHRRIPLDLKNIILPGETKPKCHIRKQKKLEDSNNNSGFSKLWQNDTHRLIMNSFMF